MTRYTRRGTLALGVGALSACAHSEPVLGADVTRVVVHKKERRLFLLNQKDILRDYRVQLGFTADGPKRFYGDGRTPEGRYFVDRHNPNSRYYLSVGLDYPNAADIAYAEQFGRSPGGDIFIHGWGSERPAPGEDWTAGCISVTNTEMREIFFNVRKGTPVDIFA
ncbi:MAG: L,D-transpeptidase family protein [Pseudomonadota bacterium]